MGCKINDYFKRYLKNIHTCDYFVVVPRTKCQAIVHVQNIEPLVKRPNHVDVQAQDGSDVSGSLLVKS